MRKKILYINVFLILGAFVFNFVYLNYGYLTDNARSLKALCVIWFGLTALTNLFFANKNGRADRFCVIMALGSVTAMLGDIVIGFNFIIGAILFATGHILFTLAYTRLTPLNKRDVIISITVFLLSVVFLLTCPIVVFPSDIMRYIALVYAFIISVMVGKAISNYIADKSKLSILLALGSILFFLSDMMLVFEIFVGLTWAGKLCMALYVPAECCLAFSILLYLDKKIGVR